MLELLQKVLRKMTLFTSEQINYSHWADLRILANLVDEVEAEAVEEVVDVVEVEVVEEEDLIQQEGEEAVEEEVEEEDLVEVEEGDGDGEEEGFKRSQNFLLYGISSHFIPLFQKFVFYQQKSLLLFINILWITITNYN